MNDDYYETLELKRNANAEEIKKSYRRLSLLYHPDKNFGDIEATNKFVKINEAYEILSKGTNNQQPFATTTTTSKSFTFNDNISNLMNKEYTKRELQLVICTSIIFCIIIYYISTKFFPFISNKFKLRREKIKTLEILKQKQKDQQPIELLDNVENNNLLSHKITNEIEKINKFKLVLPLSEKKQDDLEKEKLIIKEIKKNQIKSNSNKLRKQTFSLKNPSIIRFNSENLENNSIHSTNNQQQQQQHNSIVQINNDFNNNSWQNYSNINNNSLSSSHLEMNSNDSVIRQQDIDYAISLEIDKNMIETLNQKESIEKIKRDLIKEKENKVEKFYLRKTKLFQNISAEPLVNQENIINIAIRFQSSDNLNNQTFKVNRRFLKSNTINELIDFIESNDHCPYYTSIEITTSYPKRSIKRNDLNKEITIADLNIENNSIIWVHTNMED